MLLRTLGFLVAVASMLLPIVPAHEIAALLRQRPAPVAK